MHKADLITALALAAVIATPAAAVAYDYSGPEHVTYSTDWTLDGYRAVVEQTGGRLNLRHGERIVGYYLAGTPHAIGFGCDGAQMPVIAVEASDLPRCDRVAPIEAAR